MSCQRVLPRFLISLYNRHGRQGRCHILYHDCSSINKLASISNIPSFFLSLFSLFSVRHGQPKANPTPSPTATGSAGSAPHCVLSHAQPISRYLPSQFKKKKKVPGISLRGGYLTQTRPPRRTTESTTGHALRTPVPRGECDPPLTAPPATRSLFSHDGCVWCFLITKPEKAHFASSPRDVTEKKKSNAMS